MANTLLYVFIIITIGGLLLPQQQQPMDPAEGGVLVNLSYNKGLDNVKLFSR